MQKINLLGVVKDHFLTLRVVGKDGVSLVDLFLFFGIPFSLAGVLWWNGVVFDDEVLGQLSVGFSIIFGFLLNVQVLIFSIGKKADDSDKNVLVRETISNVSFAIMISLMILILTVSMLFVNYYANTREWLNTLLNFLLFVLILDILMIFKRIHAALQDELK